MRHRTQRLYRFGRSVGPAIIGSAGERNSPNQWTTNLKKKKIGSVMNMLLRYLFASMKLEKGHKKLLDSSFKIMLPL